MGALHAGHMSLIQASKKKCDLTICSIFVNPAQFNDPKDLQRYPRTVEEDIKLLEAERCDVLFLPQVEDVYPNGLEVPFEFDFGGLDTVMEGAHRPGHFKGVANVVDRFFKLVQPQFAFFGQKDFQQLAIIRHLVKVKNHPIEIVGCETLRNNSGLALSSRNMLLSEHEKHESLIIYKTLKLGIELIKQVASVEELMAKLTANLSQSNLKLEYLELADPSTLLKKPNLQSPVHCFIAAYCGKVRLIDNMLLH